MKHYFHSDIDDIMEIDIKDGEDLQISDNHSANAILKVMNELPHGYRIVLNLYVVEGYKHKEIAEILDINVGTSKSQLSKARKIIQEKLSSKK